MTVPLAEECVPVCPHHIRYPVKGTQTGGVFNWSGGVWNACYHRYGGNLAKSHWYVGPVSNEVYKNQKGPKFYAPKNYMYIGGIGSAH